jgi:hypothetical protein
MQHIPGFDVVIVYDVAPFHPFQQHALLLERFGGSLRSTITELVLLGTCCEACATCLRTLPECQAQLCRLTVSLCSTELWSACYPVVCLFVLLAVRKRSEHRRDAYDGTFARYCKCKQMTFWARSHQTQQHSRCTCAGMQGDLGDVPSDAVKQHGSTHNTSARFIKKHRHAERTPCGRVQCCHCVVQRA